MDATNSPKQSRRIASGVDASFTSGFNQEKPPFFAEKKYPGYCRMNSKNSTKERARKGAPLQPIVPLPASTRDWFQPLFSYLVLPLWRGIIVQDVLILILSILLANGLWGENLNAKFGLFDDHEIVSYLGVRAAMPFAEAMSFFKQTEAFQPGISNRYRPTYFFLRFLEIYLWGDSPHLWYLSRMAMFVVTLTIAWAILARICGLGLSSFLILFSLRSPYWASIWAVLGPAETYACLGLAIYFLGVFLCWRHPVSRNILGWSLILTGTLISAGAKENFPLLAIPTSLLFARQYKGGALSWKVTPLALGAIGFCVFVLNAALIGANRVKQDTYAQPIGADRLKPLVSELSFANAAIWALLIIFCGFLVLFLSEKNREARKDIWRWASRAVMVETVLYGLYLALIFFYYGKWQPESRYAFPGELIQLAMFAYLLITFLNIPRIASQPNMAVAKNILIGIGITWLLALGFEKNIQFARTSAHKTAALQDAILKCQRTVADDPLSPIVLYSQDLGDYEPLFAVKSFLLHTGMKNPIMVEIASDFGHGAFSAPVIPMLLKSLKTLEEGASGFTARALLNEKQLCYYVGFGVVPKSTRCSVITVIR